MIGDRKIILIISDDEENRLLGQQSYLRGKRVLTSTCENGWDNVCRYASRLYAVFMDIDDYEKGLAISLLAVKTGAHYIGLIAETVPDLLDEAIFSVNGARRQFNQRRGVPSLGREKKELVRIPSVLHDRGTDNYFGSGEVAGIKKGAPKRCSFLFDLTRLI